MNVIRGSVAPILWRQRGTGPIRQACEIDRSASPGEIIADMTRVLAGTHHGFVTVGEEFWGPDGDPRLRSIGAVLAAWPEDPNGFAIRTALHTGRVSVEAAAFRTDPGIDLDEWEDADQMLFETSASTLLVLTAMGDGEESENLIEGPGQYVVRCAARGRDAFEALTEGVAISPEEYRLEVWPATPQDQTSVLKVTSGMGRERVARDSA